VGKDSWTSKIDEEVWLLFSRSSTTDTVSMSPEPTLGTSYSPTTAGKVISKSPEPTHAATPEPAHPASRPQSPASRPQSPASRSQSSTLWIPWMPDDSSRACIQCEKAFTVFSRRHHCYTCGRLFCAACAPRLAKQACARVPSGGQCCGTLSVSVKRPRCCSDCDKKPLEPFFSPLFSDVPPAKGRPIRRSPKETLPEIIIA